MQKLFYNLGKKVGKSWRQGQYLYTTLTGNSVKSLQAEYALGLILSRDIEKETPLLDEPIDQLLAESILIELKRRVKNKERYFTVKILASSDLNAFALPGGFIYLTSTLVENLTNDKDALAFVLAHEMVHIVLKHPLKRIITSYSLDAISRIFKVGSALGVIGKGVIRKLIHSHYSREHELEADEFGLRLMYSAGYNPKGAIRLMSFFEQMKKDDGFRYFSTHPSLNERKANLLHVIAEFEKNENA